MKVKYIDLTAVPMYGGFTCMSCCFHNLNRVCIRSKFKELGPCISKTKYYKHFPKSDIFEL